MTDLEICQKIAEIDGVPVYYEDNKFYGSNYFRKDTHHDLAPVVYDPLKDDALCFQLMIKYRVTLHAHPNGGSHAVIHNGSCVTILSAVLNKSPNRAICLAIIEAHKKEEDE